MTQRPGKSRIFTLSAAFALALGAAHGPAAAAENIVNAPAAERVSQESGGLKNAYFAGGCFWGVEAVFSHMKGVKSAVSGYHGGNAETASYQQVVTGTTGHAEAVRVVYDPSVVRYDQLVQVLFSVIADPTLKDRQGPDVGPQYRAALIPVSDDQRAVAQAYLKQMASSGKWNAPIQAKIEQAKKFYPAEEYHQDFAKKNPNNPYIRRWDAPKVAAFETMYPDLYLPRFQTG